MTAVRRDHGHTSDGTVATLLCAAQLAASAAVLVVETAGRADAYGRPPGSALGLLFLLVAGPPAALFLGAAHTAVVTAPAAWAADALAGRMPGARWRRRTVAVAALAAVYAIPLAWAGAPYVYAWAWTAGSAVLPLLGVDGVRRLEERRGRRYGRAALVTCLLGAGAGLVTLAAAGCAALLATGATGGYEAPSLNGEQMRGVWSGEDGQVWIRLDGGRRAELSGLPYETPGGEREHCDGAAAWLYVPRAGAVRGTVEFTPADPSCEPAVWTLGGTEDRPELYALFGDPDAGDVRVLTRQGP
ncbi:hypothetical protein CP967_14135 [Streptomyces nitrosporeus]|uniref:Uncharacterized protein n=1 Tax=Streptomyces nitrosporeus TaxID=28894 RepID=A0A5J6FDB9_9ACTN|nr:hypothetical protein [Streptomyces nitrosporeus]QEU72995.1 hypothetical protein CP967_14135 [Streptomyces nitrosporeus]GGZ14265.1 hypothetical protein GCM10010327_51600 [Streptomyces nitrosporeus]